MTPARPGAIHPGAAGRACSPPDGPSSGVMGGVSHSALLRQPRSASSGRGPYAVHRAISAVGRISPRRGPALQSAPPTSGSRHSRALDF
ncbi:hypothetical protein NDU88_009089 [Pleurodeles waltl]|uniref:Uncharacterized protein n=1 Tax=Pleurodeles waltl TaxID=8319 RepID=A0AAV7RXD2_PLEWA|nr:hypothetical protein NDU88_009089 [Pleurodeles waltl]